MVDPDAVLLSSRLISIIITETEFADSSKVEILLPTDARCDNFTCTCLCCNDAVLKCSAPTLPEAEYKWLFGDTETEGSTIKPTADGNYTCIAYNTVNNQQFTGNKSISISKFYGNKHIQLHSVL